MHGKASPSLPGWNRRTIKATEELHGGVIINPLRNAEAKTIPAGAFRSEASFTKAKYGPRHCSYDRFTCIRTACPLHDHSGKHLLTLTDRARHTLIMPVSNCASAIKTPSRAHVRRVSPNPLAYFYILRRYIHICMPSAIHPFVPAGHLTSH